jgi:nicotinamidase-related amidase
LYYKSQLQIYGLVIALGLHSSMGYAASIIDEWSAVKVPLVPPTLKSVTVDSKTTALLMLDFVKPICGSTPRCLASIPQVKKLLDSARKNGTMVLYTSTPDIPLNQILADIAPFPSDPHVQSYIDKFIHSDLETILKNKGIKTVICVGVTAVGAVMNTASHAAQVGFKVIVPADGLSASDLYLEQYAVWQLTHAPIIPKNITLTSIDRVRFKGDPTLR